MIQRGDEEVLVLWTEQKPFSLLTAITLKQWVTTQELREMIDAIRAKEVVIIIDACHSGGAIPELMKKHGRQSDWSGSEAVIASSKAKQFSHFTLDGSHGLFTFYLSEAMGSGSDTLRNAFENAAKETSSYLEMHEEECADMLWKILHTRLACVQTPVDYDPTGLLGSIRLR